MKKVKLILSLSIIVLSLCYLSSCIRNSIEPKIYMYNPEVTFTTMEFDLKVVEPEEILIKEIYIKLYKENELEKTLSSDDSINKVGTTEDICFRKLDPKTRYKLEFSFDYFEQDYENEDVVIYTYSFTTKEDIGIFGDISNHSVKDGVVSINALFEDTNDIASSFDIYFYKGKEIIKHYDIRNGLGTGTNRCEFGPLLPNEDYTIVLCMTFKYNEIVYEDFILDSLDINPGDYFKVPTAKFSNVKVVEDVITFDVNITDQQNALKSLSVALVDANDIILQEIKMNSSDGLMAGYNMKRSFDSLFPNTSYSLKVIADYRTPDNLVQNTILEEYSFRTEVFNILPKATITQTEETDDKINFTYEVKDNYSLITSLRCEIRNVENKIVRTITLANDKSSATFSLNKTSDLAYFKIDFIADYSYLLYKKKNVIIGSYGSLESPKEDFFYSGGTEIVIEKYIGKSKICSIPKMIDGRKVVSIGQNAFMESDVTNVLIPDTVTTIYHYAFKDCSDLESVVIPNSVTYIGFEAFSGCSKLVKVAIPDSVTWIQTSTFENCSSLTNIIIPNSVTNIGDYAFSGCKNLVEVDFAAAKNLEKIGASAFSGCSLTSIVIPDSVKEIRFNAFVNCTSLKNIILPKDIEYIASNTFQNCSSLTSIVIPNKVTSIERSAFSGCSSLEKVLIPDSVRSINYDAFLNCSNLESIVIPESVTDIFGFPFSGCNIKQATGTIDAITRLPKTIEEMTIIGDGSISLRPYVYDSLISITIGDDVTSIEQYAFSGCKNLTNIIIGSSVERIGACAFSGCAKLKSIVIPISVTEMEEYVFDDCVELIIYCEANSKPSEWSYNWMGNSPTVHWGYKRNE